MRTHEQSERTLFSIASEEPNLVLGHKSQTYEILDRTEDTCEEKENRIPRSTSTSTEATDSVEIPTHSHPTANNSIGATMGSYKYTLDTIEEKMKMKVAYLSDTLNRQQKRDSSDGGSNGVSEYTENANKRTKQSLRNPVIENSIKNTELQVKKKIAEIIDNYSYKT